jgi:hypothetical protein
LVNAVPVLLNHGKPLPRAACGPRDFPQGDSLNFPAWACQYFGAVICEGGSPMRVRTDLVSSINRGFPYLRRGCIVVLAIVFTVTAELLASTTWSASSATALSVQTVLRAHKTDRLPLYRYTVATKLPEGCESIVGSVANSPLAQMARNCQS